MELALSLGDTSKALSRVSSTSKDGSRGFCIALGDHNTFNSKPSRDDTRPDPPLQLHLLPFTPLPSPHSRAGRALLDVNLLAAEDGGDDGTPVSSSSPNSGSSFQMEFRSKRENEAEDDDDNASTRKKLRLSKEQSAFLEESFKEHTTLNPKQKLALAKQLNLRPRQVEVWFQNRRARTKLKQTEVDCEYLKRCCETLTEENRRLQKELQELRALKTSQPFYMQLPATTLTMCPSCERVATTTNNNNNNASSTKHHLPHS